MNGPDFDIAVVGGGIAGLTAAYHAAFSGLSVASFRGKADLLGGLVANVGELDGFPAIGPLAGIVLATKLVEAGASLGVQSVAARIDKIERSGMGFKLVATERSWNAKRVIVATGAQLKTIEIPGVEKFKGQGILQCAWCNAGLFRDQEVVIIGGGDSALQEALHIAKYASVVTIVTHGDQLRARQRYVTAASDMEKIRFRWSTEPIEIVGEDKVESIRLRDKVTGSIEELCCTGVFVFVGLAANTELVGDFAAKDHSGFIVTNGTYETKTSGLFAVGAVRSGYMGRLTNAVGEATTSAMTAVSQIDH